MNISDFRELAVLAEKTRQRRRVNICSIMQLIIQEWLDLRRLFV